MANCEHKDFANLRWHYMVSTRPYTVKKLGKFTGAAHYLFELEIGKTSGRICSYHEH